MSTIPTPAQAKPIGDYGHGSFDGSSKLFQSNSGSNSYVEGGDVGNYVNDSMLYPSLDNSTTIGAINALKGDIAPGYEESATSYDAGEYVIFEGVLYRCNTAITAPAGTFNPSLWDVATVAEFMDVANLPTATVDSTDVIPFIDVSDSNKPKSTTAAAVAGLALLSSFKVVAFNLASCTVPANGNKALLGTDFVDTTDVIPSGYSPMAFVGDYSTNNNIIFNKIECTQAGSTGIFVTLKNVTSSDQTGYVQVKILYIKNSLL